LHIFSLSTTWGCVVSATFQLLYHQNWFPVLIAQEAGWALGLVQMGVEKRKSLVPVGVWIPNCPSHSKTLHQICCLLFCWSCIIIYQYRKTNKMHFYIQFIIN
jgi:hypothetical protein